MTVPDKPRSPAQKYRLTNKGRRAIATADGSRDELNGRSSQRP